MNVASGARKPNVEIQKGLFLALVTLAGCNKERSPVVVIDDWWTIDYAKNACASDPSHCTDTNDPGGVLDYIDRLKAQFAASSTCKGVSVFDYRGPNVEPPSGMPTDDNREQLIIDYQPGQATQSFAIMGKPSNKIAGEGSIEQIVTRTCSAARGLGANVQ